MRLFRTRSFRRRSFVALLSAVILGTGLAVPLAVSTAVTAAAITPRAESDQRGAANLAEAQRVNCDVGTRIPVNCATGNLWETTSELAVAGRGRALAFERTYNAAAAATASAADALGWGWTHSYAMKLTVDAGTGAVTVIQENGATVTFTPSGGTYTAPQWVLARLVHNADGTWTFTLPDQRADHFDTSGRLISQTDRNGYVTNLAYVAGQLASVTDPAGRSLTFTYDALGRLVAVADPMGRTVGFGYDGVGNLFSVIDPVRHVTSYGYDAAHRLTAMTDRNGGTTTVAYDGSHRVVTQTDPLSRTTTIAYSGATTTVTDPAGNVVTRTVDVQGNLTTMTRGFGTPLAATWTHVYDTTKGQRTSTTDPNGHISSATWDTRGNQLSATDGLWRTTTATYNALNDPLTVTDAMGVTTTFAYDAAGNLLSQSTPLVGSSPAVSRVVGYTYGDPAHPGDVTAITDPNGNVWSQTWDSVGNLTSESDPLGNRTTYGYNPIGWRTATTSPRGNQTGAVPAAFTTTVTYNPLGNPTAVTDPLGGRTVYGYDNNQNRVSETDPNGHTTTSVFNAADELTQMTRPDGSVATTTYTGASDVATQTDGLGHTNTFTYDALRRLVSTTDPLGRSTSFGYDPAGNRVTKADPGGTCPTWPISYPTGRSMTLNPGQQCTLWQYDAADQSIRTEYSEGTTPNVLINYDAAGRPTLYSLWGAQYGAYGPSISLQYDSLGRLTRTDDDPGNLNSLDRVEYGYDLAGNLTSLTYPPGIASQGGSLAIVPGGQTATRTYDAAGRLVSVQDWDGATTTFAYDPDSHIVDKSYPNGVATTTAYDPAGRIAQIRTLGPTGLPILDLVYGRDGKGQVATAQSSLTSAAGASYGYDAADRLTRISGLVGPTAATIQNYSYDAADRVTRTSIADVQTNFGYDAADQLATTTSPVGTSTFTYDSRGNRLERADDVQGVESVSSYGYDQANRLIRYVPPAEQGTGLGYTGYDYTADGLLDGVVLGQLFWNRADPVPTMMGDKLGAFYITGPDGLPIERTDAGGKLYYHQDALGSTRLLTDKNGAVIQTYSYDPYGNTTASGAAAVANPFQYAGQYTDPVSGLIHTNGRWYDPTTAQFLTTNNSPSVVGSPYTFAGNNPINVPTLKAHGYGVPEVAEIIAGAAAATTEGRMVIGLIRELYKTAGAILDPLRMPPWSICMDYDIGKRYKFNPCNPGEVSPPMATAPRLTAYGYRTSNNFNDCINGGGYVSSYLDPDGWTHYCNGGSADGRRWNWG